VTVVEPRRGELAIRRGENRRGGDEVEMRPGRDMEAAVLPGIGEGIFGLDEDDVKIMIGFGRRVRKKSKIGTWQVGV